MDAYDGCPAASVREPIGSRMKSGKKWIGWMLQGIALSLTGQLLAAPVGRDSAEAAAKGWLADEHPHLAARFHPQIKSVESFSGFYVVHLQPEGFVVTTADDEMEPVLAFADKGDFKYDPENPLCLMLNRDVPARSEHLRKAKAQRTNAPMANAASPTVSTNTDDPVIAASQRAKAKWEKYKNHPASAASNASVPMAQSGLSLSVAPPLGDDTSSNVVAAPPVHIQGIKIVDGRVQLTHDATGSVTIYASYDYGQTWQVEDSGIVWPTWTARQPVQESSCWYRVAADQLYDSLTVSLMRNPPPQTESLELMTNDAPDPGSDPGLVGSKGVHF